MIFFGPSPETSGHGSFEVVVILELPGGDEFGDLLLERVADAFEFAEAFFLHEFLQWLIQALDDARAVEIGACFERILALEFQQGSDLN
jgi:hypothetical protein